MTFKRIKMQWAKRLLQAKYFVVMTEKESAIFFDGVEPTGFNDLLVLSAQVAELEEFRVKLDELIQYHRQAVDKITGESSEAQPQKATTVPKKSKNIQDVV